MRNIMTICKREVKAFFVSPMAYFVITGFVLLAAYFFFNMLGYFNLILARYRAMPYAFGTSGAPNLNQWVIEGFFQTLILILVFLVPVLTMRIIAEERKKGTFELLFTSPISVFDVIVGKYLAVCVITFLMVLCVMAFPALLCMFGNPEVKPIFSGALGVVLSAFAFVSIGMAASSFTQNQIVAAITSMVVLLLLYVIHSPAESLGGTTGEVLKYLSPSLQVQDLVRGVISVKALVYFGSLIAFGVFVSQRALDAQRWR